jgi:hypothetical protein
MPRAGDFGEKALISGAWALLSGSFYRGRSRLDLRIGDNQGPIRHFPRVNLIAFTTVALYLPFCVTKDVSDQRRSRIGPLKNKFPYDRYSCPMTVVERQSQGRKPE